MAIKEGDFVEIEFTGKVEETGEIFDTTSQDIAEEEGIFVEQKKYGPITIIVGANHLLPAIEEAIIGLDTGDSKNLTLEPEKAFGERDPGLVQLFSMKEFKKQGMTPVPGMIISAEGQQGKVLTVNGGRVKVDFNNALAGKTLNYDINIAGIVEDETEKVKSMVGFHYSSQNMDLDKVEVEFEDKIIKIKLDEITRFDQKSYMDVTLERYRISKDLYENLPYEKVQFIDEFQDRKVEETEEADEE